MICRARLTILKFTQIMDTFTVTSAEQKYFRHLVLTDGKMVMSTSIVEPVITTFVTDAT